MNKTKQDAINRLGKAKFGCLADKPSLAYLTELEMRLFALYERVREERFIVAARLVQEAEMRELGEID